MGIRYSSGSPGVSEGERGFLILDVSDRDPRNFLGGGVVGKDLVLIF